MTTLLFKAPSELTDNTDEDPYVVEFRKAAMQAEVLHVLEFEYINQDSLKLKVQHPEKFGGIIFTSPRSVIAVKRCVHNDLHKEEWQNHPLYVVGDSTLKVLQQELGLFGIGEASGSAELLASYICEDVAGKQIMPLLFPCAEQRLAILPNTLTANNIPVDVITAYRTVPHQQLEERLKTRLKSQGSDVEMLVFFSPSGVTAVSSIFNNLGLALDTFKVVAIGPSTEQALRQKGLHVFATATKPSPSSLVESIKSALGQTK